MSDFPEKSLGEEPEEQPAGSEPLPEQDVFDPENSTIFSKPAERKPVKTASHKMLRNLILAAVVLCLLGGGAALVQVLIPAKDTASSSEVETAEVTVASCEVSDIAKLAVTNAAGSFTAYPTEDTPASSDASEGDTILWNLEGIDDALVDNAVLETTVQSAAEITASRKIADAGEGLASYGLDAPSATVAVTGYSEGIGYTLLIGGTAPNGSGSYAMLSGGDSIYLLDTATVENFTVAPTYFADKKVVGAIEKTDANAGYFGDDGSLNQFDSIVVSGKNHPQALVFKKNPYTSSLVPYIMEQPVRQNVADDKFKPVFSVISAGLTADSAYVYYPTAAQLAEYHLNDPETLVTYKVGADTVELKAAAGPDEGYYAVMTNQSPMIYKVAVSDMPYVTNQPISYFSPVVLMDDITSVKSIEVSAPDRSYSFQLTHGQDESGNATLNVASAGAAVDETDFRNYYQTLLMISPLEFTEAASTGKEIMTVTVRYTDDARAPAVLKFTVHSDLRYHLATNGNPLGLVSSKSADNILAYAGNLIEGKEVPSPMA